MDDQPDIGPEEFEVHATAEQTETCNKMRRLGWEISHLWEYEQGMLAVWMIAHTPGQKGFTHAFVKPNGELHRYENKVRIGGKSDRGAAEDY